MPARAIIDAPMTNEPILETYLVAPPAHEVRLGHRFTVGGVISKTVSVWWKHVLAFTALSVVVYSPFAVTFGLVYAWMPWAGGVPRQEELPKLAIAMVGVGLLTLVLTVIQAGAVTYGTVRHLSGERARFADMLGAGFRRGLPVVGVGLLLWLGTVLGTLLLVVPGMLFMVATCVAVPAAVVEKPGVFGAIRRSFALTRGRRWPLFAAGFALLVMMWVLAAVVQVGATVAFAALLPPQKAAAGVLVASQLGNVLFSAIPLIGISVAYHELRAEKEGVDTAALARVFE